MLGRDSGLVVGPYGSIPDGWCEGDGSSGGSFYKCSSGVWDDYEAKLVPPTGAV